MRLHPEIALVSSSSELFGFKNSESIPIALAVLRCNKLLHTLKQIYRSNTASRSRPALNTLNYGCKIKGQQGCRESKSRRSCSTRKVGPEKIGQELHVGWRQHVDRSRAASPRCCRTYLVLDIVGRSKLLADEQNALVQEVNQIAFSSRPSARFAIIAVDFHAHLTWEFFRNLNN